MVWNEDYTTPNTWQPANLDVGNKSTTVSVAHRHKPMQGDLINRDESRNRGTLKLDGNALRNNGGNKLVFEVEKFDGDGFSCYRLRDTASKKLLYINRDWMRLGEEGEIPEVDTLLCFERYVMHQICKRFLTDLHDRWEGFKPYMHNYGEIAWHLWIKSRAERIYIDSDGWLNSKDSGSLALFTFSKEYDSASDGELARKDGETDDAYIERLDELGEKRADESPETCARRRQAIIHRIRSVQKGDES